MVFSWGTHQPTCARAPEPQPWHFTWQNGAREPVPGVPRTPQQRSRPPGPHLRPAPRRASGVVDQGEMHPRGEGLSPPRTEQVAAGAWERPGQDTPRWGPGPRPTPNPGRAPCRPTRDLRPSGRPPCRPLPRAAQKTAPVASPTCPSGPALNVKTSPPRGGQAPPAALRRPGEALVHTPLGSTARQVMDWTRSPPSPAGWSLRAGRGLSAFIRGTLQR